MVRSGIRIEVKKAKQKDQWDISAPIVNAACEGVANQLKDLLKDSKCSNHPNAISVIKVVAKPNRKSLFEIQKTLFCCKNFEDSINIDIKA